MDSSREAYWRRKLWRIRFGAEPVSEQVARQFRVTVALTVIPCGIGLIFLAIFAAFGRGGRGGGRDRGAGGACGGPGLARVCGPSGSSLGLPEGMGGLQKLRRPDRLSHRRLERPGSSG